jgi:hypothetical protein
MKMTEIKIRAKKLGIVPGKMKKADLIHAIQAKENNFTCFQTGLITCDQYKCCWRNDCLPEDTGTEKKESYRDKIKGELDEFKEKLEELKKTAQTLIGKKKEEALAEIKNLEAKSEKEVREKLHGLAEASEDAWHTIRKGIDSSWDELKKATQKVLAKFK